jgi:hypothetical protein
MYTVNMENSPESQVTFRQTNPQMQGTFLSIFLMVTWNIHRAADVYAALHFERGKLPQPQPSRDPVLPPSRDIRHATVFGWERGEVTQGATTGSIYGA